MPTINTNDPINLGEFITALRKCIRLVTASSMKVGMIDGYTEKPYDEDRQIYEIELSFNEGDMRTMLVSLDVDPDISWKCPECKTTLYGENIPEIGQPCPVCEEIRTE